MKHFPLWAAIVLLAAGCADAPEKGSLVGDYLSGRVAASSNNIGVAAASFDGAQAEGAPAEEVLRGAFFFKVAIGDIEGAADLAGDILANNDKEDDDLARLTLAARDLKAGKYAAARQALAAKAEVEYFSAAMVIVDAWALAGDEGPEAALKALASRDGETFRGFHPLHQAFLFEQAGLDDEARTAYQLAMMGYGGVVARDAYGSFLERSGDADAARAHYELLAQYPGLDRQVAERGLRRLDADKTDRRWTDVTPQKGAAIALYSFGAAILQQVADQRSAAEKAGFRVGDANYDMPLAFTRIALYLWPDFDHAQRLAGAILNAYGDNERAIEMLRRIPKSSAFYEQARIDIAGGLIGLGREEEAEKVLRAAAKTGKSLEVKFTYANLLASRDRYREAAQV